MKKVFLGILFLCLHQMAMSQTESEVPQNYFHKPLDIPILLSGTFGELRSNHFHSGMDIKTQGRTEIPIKASAEGYVSRIKIQRYGYGKALYITHPNGYQTVYAHLNHFAPDIEAYVKKAQYKKESYTIELFPAKDKIKVDQGELIAYSGNSGSSGGPHLHFEIRDPNSRPMNPFLFGFEDIEDTKAPTIRGLYAYPLTKKSIIDGSRSRKKIKLSKIGEDSYKAEALDAFGDIGFGFDAYDQFDLAYNKNGLYSAEAYENGKKIFETKFDRFSFAETRYINRMIDYTFLKEYKKRIQKLFLQPNLNLDLAQKNDHDGILRMDQDSTSITYRIDLKDYMGNTKTIQIPIETKRPSELPEIEEKRTPYFAQSKYASAFDNNQIDIYIPKNALYEDTYLDIQFGFNEIKVHEYTTPLHKSMSIGFDVSEFSEEDKSKLYIAKIFPWGSYYYSNTKKKKNRFVTYTKDFGTYGLKFDNEKPTIKPINFRDGKWMSNYRYLKLKIDDAETGIDAFRATVNGKFILMEYDYKTKILTHDFNDNVVTDTRNKLKVVVTDKVGNTRIFEANFNRKK
ncbi:M23 family metallopeptidase [Psychroflexus halocasei]|uniref:Peptidase family M23 n=1 Tax=Psychroflexus halocasei TaxID=908615 RepID=A0A1H3YLZ2_9FLAO|nr:M23 family metallopeptidase [Psychroflexus halocasei]SEA12543.1 Peptidase family M23 [Psychroflexus halocasei]